jgi:hypothetical protein
MDLSLVGMISYFKNNWESVYVFVWLMFMIILLFNAFNIDVSNVGSDKKKHIDRIAIYQEGFKEGASDKKPFCERDNIKDACKKLSAQKSCTAVDCCVWTLNKQRKEGCEEGDKDGPDMDQDDNGVSFDEYWYKKERKKIN